MRQLLKFREWLTIAEASEHLTDVLSEKVTEADVLRLALDGHLRLSVQVTNVMAMCGEVRSQAEFDAIIGYPAEHMRLREDQIVEFVREEQIHGIWDLPMIGFERLDVDERYQSLGGHRTDVSHSAEATLVQREPRTVCRLIRVEPDGFRRTTPLTRLPDDAPLIVRRQSLDSFEAALRAPRLIGQPLTGRERNTLLVIIAALAKMASLNLNHPSAAAAKIAAVTQQLGSPVSETAIENKLKLIQSALEERQPDGMERP